tara:strand:+ start:351 stop:551 length:201 start_codon:yes stop_codon:yes gene_type:complete
MFKKVKKILWKQNPEKDIWQEPNPDDLTIDNAYKTRWIWYHTILGIEIAMTNILLLSIVIILAIKL